MTMGEALNRGFNLLATALVAVSSFAFAPMLSLHESPYFALDDWMLIVLGLVTIWWYLRRNNRFKRTLVPIFLAAIALGIKVLGLIVHDGSGHPVDSYGGIILFVLIVITVVFQYYKTGRLIDSFKF
jgi:hypothetical protein